MRWKQQKYGSSCENESGIKGPLNRIIIFSNIDTEGFVLVFVKVFVLIVLYSIGSELKEDLKWEQKDSLMNHSTDAQILDVFRLAFYTYTEGEIWNPSSQKYL